MSKPITKIFIDLDGVLADFHSAGFRLFGKDPAEMPCNFDGWLPDVLGCTEAEFWQRIDEAYWIGLEELPDARQIVGLCEEYSDLVGILTSPGSDPRACSGKKAWVVNHFPELTKRTYIGSDKGLIGHPGAVLLDDWTKNIKAWRAGGGTGILVPRRWNEEYGLDTVPTLRKRLEQLLQ